MKYASLFTGGGGLDMAVHTLFPGAELAWWSEVDTHAAAVMAAHTDAPNLGDVTAIDWQEVSPVALLLEAKVAALLDQCGKDWEYEGDAYASSHGQYVPDFTVGDRAVAPSIIEVKPVSEMTVGAFDRMSVVWDSQPDAALTVLCPDGALHPTLELVDGTAWVQFLAFPEMPCGHVRDLAFDFELIKAAREVGGLDPIPIDCPTCGEVGKPTGFWGTSDLDWDTAMMMLFTFVIPAHYAMERNAGASLRRFLPDFDFPDRDAA